MLEAALLDRINPPCSRSVTSNDMYEVVCIVGEAMMEGKICPRIHVHWDSRRLWEGRD